MAIVSTTESQRPKIVVLDDYQGVALEITDWSAVLDRADVSVIREHLASEDEVAAALSDADIVVAMRERTAFPRTLLERLPRLRLLVTTGGRNASIDVAAAQEHGVAVSGTTHSGTDAAELAWALLMAAARRLDVEVSNVRDGGWMTTVGTRLAGRTLGLVGLGKLGGAMATYANAFGMDLVAWSQNLTQERCDEYGAELAPSLESLLERSDFVSIHLLLSKRTRGLLGATELAHLRPTAWLVNTSRGPICDEQALIEACRSGAIAGAALDVYEHEPLPADHPFRTLPNVIATGHIGYVTDVGYDQWYSDVVEDIVAYLDGTPIRPLQPRA